MSSGIWGDSWLCSYRDLRITGILVCTDLGPDLRAGKVLTTLELNTQVDPCQGFSLK